MKLIKPSFEILRYPLSGNTLIEVAGRTCYKSEDKMTKDSADIFTKKILDIKHESVIEHEHATVRIICDRGVSHELVRHRLASFSQESTRYCNYSKDKHDNQLTFIIPEWLSPFIKEGQYKNTPYSSCENMAAWKWINTMEHLEERYISLVNMYNWKAQQARSILPNSLKTEIVITTNLRHWREIFRQRVAPAAHPQMREIMVPLLEELHQRIPIIFDNIHS